MVKHIALLHIRKGMIRIKFTNTMVLIAIIIEYIEDSSFIVPLINYTYLVFMGCKALAYDGNGSLMVVVGCRIPQKDVIKGQHYCGRAKRNHHTQ